LRSCQRHSASAPGYRNINYHHETDSAAAYGNITYDFTTKFSVTAGLRWTKEKKDLDINLLQYNLVNFNAGSFWETSSLIGAPVADVNSNKDVDDNWKDFTWDLTPEYRFSEHLRTFFRYARGFRSGGFNVGVTNSLDPVLAVDPEYLNSYEIGIKSEWLDGRLNANGNIFYYDYTDIQTNLLVPNPAGGVTTALANGPKADIKGAEFELDAQATEALRPLI